ncbi:cytosolic protein [Metabacillus halosaccharovorans]|uniref:Cytosolic protein n=1 Tax=Metabacillus halosaccharovorans TaxID=930124 RepID=A0ABT3DDN2_9BACI|nr:cytosolic protein [Metabacillus halosaccharovorans]MCV9885145.1 cytosolic protein [Metabacillus halosaccharovorans]
MSFVNKIKDFFSTHQETRDKHYNSDLQSRYYKTTNKKALQSVKELIEQNPGMTVTSVSEERGEMSVNIDRPRKAFLIVTVISVRPFETAVDLTATTNTVLPTDFGYSKKIILDLYKKLDQKETFVGAGKSGR